MKLLKMLPIILGLLVSTSCGEPKVQPTDLAVQAMERARAAEAPTYAPIEYTSADELFTQMNDAIAAGDNDTANTLADQVVEAANLATDIAKQNKATSLIAQLKKSLALAQEIGIDQENPDAYSQAAQLLIDAESFYQIPDYEKTIQTAQSGLDILQPLIGSSESLALANLNRARELLDRAYRTTDLTQTEATLTEASNLIEMASVEYQERNFVDSISNSQTAIDLLNDMIENYPNDASISINVNQDDNLQLQAYDLLRQLQQTLEFIKKEYGTNIMQTSSNATTSTTNTEEPKFAPLTPLTPAQPVEETTNEVAEDSTEVELLLLEDTTEEGTYADDVDTNENEITQVSLNFIPLTFKAQDMTVTEEKTNTMPSKAVYDGTNTSASTTNVTIEMIDELYNTSEQYYQENNFLNSIDASREGLRLAELFLANQTIATHTVIKGDTLWDISKGYYTTPWLWPNIWRANKLIIKDPDLIYLKQEFRIPPAPNKK